MMNPSDREFDDLLRSVAAPSRPDGYWEDFPRRVSVRLRAGASVAAPPSPTLPGWARPFSWMTVAAALCLAAFLMRRPPPPAAQSDTRAAATLFHEVSALFPGQLRAIVNDGQGVSLVLSDHPDVPAAAPIWVKLWRGGQFRSIITFSGQSVSLDGEQIDIMANARGGVIVAGPHFAWSTDDASAAAPFRIEGQALGVLQ